MKKLSVLFATLAAIAALSALEAYSQFNEGEESEILWEKIPNDYNLKSSFISAIFTPDESKVLIGNKEKLLEVDAATGNLIREIPGVFGAWQFSEDGQYFYTLDRKKIRYSTMEVVGRYTDSITGNWPMTGFSVNERSGLFIGYINQSSSEPLIENSIYIYDEKTFQLKKITGIMGHQIYDLQISPTGEFFVTSSRYDPDRYKTGDEKIIFTRWDTKTLQIIDMRDEFATAKKFSPDGKWIAVTFWNKVRIYDAQTLEKKWENAHEGWEGGILPCIAFSYDSKFIATGGNSGAAYRNIHVWDVSTGHLFSKYTQFNSDEVMYMDKIWLNRKNEILTYTDGVVFLLKSKTNTSINETQKLYEFFYNRNDKKVSVSAKGCFNKMLNIEIFNERGQKVFNNGIINYKNMIIVDISSFSKGAYFSKIIIDDKIYIEKFIKE